MAKKSKQVKVGDPNYRHPYMLQQMPPQDGDFLFCGVVLSWFLQAFSPLS